MNSRIAFQGEPGAYSHEACLKAYPGMEPMPCRTFEDAVEAVRKGDAELAMLPVENSIYGRVADIHSLLPESGLHIVDEAFVRVHINLLALPGTPLERIERAMSHTVLLGQCRDFLREHGIHRVAGPDKSMWPKQEIPHSVRSPRSLPARYTASRCSPATSRIITATRRAFSSCPARWISSAAASTG